MHCNSNHHGSCYDAEQDERKTSTHSHHIISRSYSDHRTKVDSSRGSGEV